MVKNSVAPVKIRKLCNGNFTGAEDWLAVEEPMEIQLQFGNPGSIINKIISVTMRTPGNDEELAAGFLFTEGIIQSNQQCLKIVSDPMDNNKLLVVLHENEFPVLNNADRNFYTSSSCGVCGKASIDAIKTVSIYENVPGITQLNAGLLHGLPATLKEQQSIFKSTGGLHAASLFDSEGNCLIIREDVGRHNALDKLIGTAFLKEELPLNNSILLLSGRASFELLQKAMMAGIKTVAAIGAPSSLAVQLAEDSGITLVGFLNKDRLNVYSGGQHIKF